MREITLDTRRVNDNEPCFVIAEIGNNHGGSFLVAQQMIQAAASSGADAVKLQKRDNDHLYSAEMLAQPYGGDHSYGATYGEHRKALELDAAAFWHCATWARVCGVPLFATPFDEVSADLLYRLDVPVLKLASGSLVDGPLLRHVRSGGRPLIVSTGGGTWADVDRAVDTLSAGQSPFALLHCTAAYPVRDYADLNLLAIVEMRQRYPEVVIGWSGHVSGISSAIQAYAYGARIVEMHFTLDRTLKGTDQAFSLEPVGLRKLVRDLHRASAARGDGIKRRMDCEIKPLSKMKRHPTPNGPQITGSTYAGY